jgi:hypothetical protein
MNQKELKGAMRQQRSHTASARAYLPCHQQRRP